MTLHVILSFGPGTVRSYRLDVTVGPKDKVDRAVRKMLRPLQVRPTGVNMDLQGGGIAYALDPRNHGGPYGVAWLDPQGQLPFAREDSLLQEQLLKEDPPSGGQGACDED